MIAFVVCVTLLILGLASSASIPCQNPDISQLHAQWMDYIEKESIGTPESFFAVPLYRYEWFASFSLNKLFHLLTRITEQIVQTSILYCGGCVCLL